MDKSVRQRAFFIGLAYFAVSGMAKYLHELGHAAVALFMGVRVETMTIVVNPMGGGFFRPVGVKLVGAPEWQMLFSAAGLLFPAVVLGLLYAATYRIGPRTRWWAAFLWGYSLLSNAVNYAVGFFSRGSDGGGLLFYGLPPWVLAVVCLAAAIGGIILLARDCFGPLLQASKTRTPLILLGLTLPILVGLGLAAVEHAVLRRLIFVATEVVLMGAIGWISWKGRSWSLIPRRPHQLGRAQWSIAAAGGTLSSVMAVQYFLWMMST